MWTMLSLGALGLPGDFPTSVDLALKHGFDGVAGDLGYFAALGDTAAIERAANQVRSKGLKIGPAGCPVGLTAEALTFAQQLTELPAAVDVLAAAGIEAVGTWVRPMSDDLPYPRNLTRHAERIAMVAEVLATRHIRLGLEYVGPKTFWSTERFGFVHSLDETRALIAASGAPNVGVVLDSYHWYTAHETAADIETLRPCDIIALDLNDAPEGRDVDEQQDLDRRLPGTTGVIDTPSLVAALTQIGYDGPVKVEPFMKSLAERDVDDVLTEVSAGVRAALA